MAQDYTDRLNNLQFLPFINNKCFIGYKRHQLKYIDCMKWHDHAYPVMIE